MRIQVSSQRHGHGLSPPRRQPALQRPGVCGRGGGRSAVLLHSPLPQPGRPSPAPLRGSFSRQLGLTQTRLPFLREGLLLFFFFSLLIFFFLKDSFLMTGSWARAEASPLLAGQPSVHSVGALSGFREPFPYNENDKFTRRGWLPSTGKGSALRDPECGTHRINSWAGTRPRLLSQNIRAQSLAKCIFQSFPGEDEQLSNHWPGYPLTFFQA